MLEQGDSKKKIGWGIGLVSIAFFMQPHAYAQSDAQILEAVRACQSIAGLSARLACYDEVLPPGTDTVGNVTPVVENNVSTRSREQELEEAVAELEEQLVRENISRVPTARIIEVQRPTTRSSRLIADDGRVFLESSSTTIVRWPETPFDISVNTSLTGTITISAIDPDQLNRGQGRGLGRGVRVTLER